MLWVLVALLAAEPVAGRLPDLGTITLDRQDPVIMATIAGVPARLAVVPAEDVEIAPVFAARTTLTWDTHSYQQVGRVRVPLRETAGDISIADISTPHRMITQDGPCCRGHDGSIGATQLPWSTVRFGADPTGTEERWSTSVDDRSGLNIAWKVAGQTIHIVLSPDSPDTTATASAAVLLARAYGGHLQKAVRQTPIAFGVLRSVRDMDFETDVPLLSFSLTRIAVRVADFAGDQALLDTMQTDPVDDETAPIVVRHRSPPPQFRWPAITVGRDLLDHCPVISVYRDVHMIGLICARR